MSLTDLRISVVMPTLNQREFISSAIGSVFDQRIADLELIVMDGGSTDGTQGILEQFANRFGDCFRWFSQADSGPAQAVNRAVADARSTVIGWLNSDDRYAPDALSRALAVLSDDDNVAMVYGEGMHIDADGHAIGAYPTRAADTPIDEFAQGCFICQPTALFRKTAFMALGGLDESLKAAFDFDLWLRMFKAFPGCIRHISDIQAESRLHAGGITSRERERVALEGMAVLARHLGAAPPEWLLTHFKERAMAHPFAGSSDLRGDLTKLTGIATKWISRVGERRLREFLANDVSLRLATTNLFVDVHPDGWAPRVLDIRLLQPARPYAGLRIAGRHANPLGTPLRVSIESPGEPAHTVSVELNGDFEWRVPLYERRAGAHVVLRLTTDACFVPARSETGSTDTRELAFLVDSVKPL